MGLDPKENHVAICFLRKAGTGGPPLKAIASRGRFIQPSVKYFDE